MSLWPNRAEKPSSPLAGSFPRKCTFLYFTDSDTITFSTCSAHYSNTNQNLAQTILDASHRRQRRDDPVDTDGNCVATASRAASASLRLSWRLPSLSFCCALLVQLMLNVASSLLRTLKRQRNATGFKIRRGLLFFGHRRISSTLWELRRLLARGLRIPSFDVGASTCLLGFYT